MERFYRKGQEEMAAKPKMMAWPQIMSFVSGLFVGAIAGAGVMFLFAPRAGRHTRARLQHQVDELREQVIEGFEDTEEDVLTQAQRVTANLREKAKELQHRGEKALSHK